MRYFFETGWEQMMQERINELDEDEVKRVVFKCDGEAPIIKFFEDLAGESKRDKTGNIFDIYVRYF